MNFQLTEQDLMFKLVGSAPKTFRSEDYTVMSSGSYLTVSFGRATSSITLHNRTDYSVGGSILFYLDGIGNTPVTLANGENLTIAKGMASGAVLQSTVNNATWQIVVTF